MPTRRLPRSMAILLVALPLASQIARADNAMNYRMETAEQAASLQRSGSSLGMRVGAEHEIRSGGMTFELLKVSTSARALRRRRPG